MNQEALREAVERLAASGDDPDDERRSVVRELLGALERGEVRAAERIDGRWRVHAWVKQGILLAFRVGRNRPVSLPPVFHFCDRDTLPTWDPAGSGRDVRVVPGGSTVRSGAFLGNGVVVMPPAYVNVGAWVGENSMIDSHVLVGSCAQIGEGVHLSAAVQVGGVLEPVGALPVIVEDRVFVGGGCGIYEGTRVGRGAVLAPGVILTRATALHDLVLETVHLPGDEGALEVPAGAVVVPGSRPARGAYARAAGLHLQAPVIVKYRDAGTDAAVALEGALR